MENKVHRLTDIKRFPMSSGEECEILSEDILASCKENFINLGENVKVVEPGNAPFVAELIFSWDKRCGYAMLFYRRDSKLFCRRTYEYRLA